ENDHQVKAGGNQVAGIKFILPSTNPFFANIKLWRRYIDDILIVWHGPLETVSTFTEWVNTLNPFLRFTSTMSTNEISFLDLLIMNGKLITSTYQKPTDRNSLLTYDSHHPKSLRDNLPFGQFLRLRRNCSSTHTYNTQANDLQTKLLARNYPREIVNRAPKRARNNNREALLEPNTRDINKSMTCVTTFTPLSNKIKRTILKRWSILGSSGCNIPRPLFAFKRSQNIKDVIIHTRPRNITQTQ
ncbi:hypothetical protein NDU88_004425, partial [Pleurodeles waltl]